MKRMIAVSIVVAFFAVAFVGCGSPVPPNELALVLKTLGDRSTSTINKDEKATTSTKVVDAATSDTEEESSLDNFESELITCVRAPIQTPGVLVIRFPLGVQAYKFSSKPSVESPEDEAFAVDAMGGKITFDTVFHMQVDPSYPDIKERLVKLVQTYQLRRYSGDANVFVGLMSGRFRQLLKKPFIEYSADKTVLTLMRGKKEMNKYALDKLNERFNPLGLKFTLASVSSAMTVPTPQQNKLNEIVEQDAKFRVLELTNIEIKPLEAQIAQFKEDGITSSAAIVNAAKAEKINLIAAAQKKRKQLFVGLVGPENYILMETMMIMVKNLENGKTNVSIVPAGSTIILNDQSTGSRPALPVPQASILNKPQAPPQKKG